LRANLLILILILCGCHSASKLPNIDKTKLPSTVDGATDPSIIKLEEKLAKKGVKIIIIGQLYLISIPSPLLFVNESPKLQWNSYNLLNDVVAYLQKFRKISVHINSYNCCYLSEKRTRALTLARSRNVANYLWSRNLETRLVFTQGIGNDKPIVAYAKCTDSSPNSRTEIAFRRAII
jgi:intracellular multiplication protein IcmN